jgi:hypothetical protein
MCAFAHRHSVEPATTVLTGGGRLTQLEEDTNMNEDISKAGGSLRSPFRSMRRLCAALTLIGLGLAGCRVGANPDAPGIWEPVTWGFYV